jgi:hypothetical protein
MDWVTLAASIGGSGAAVAALGYVLKVAAERSLDVRISKLQQENKAQIQEQFRRQAFLWDRQFEAARSLLSLIYRFRNAFRELSLVLSSDDEAKIRKAAEILRRLNAYGEAVSEILYEERAVLPEPLFRAAHELKTPLLQLRSLSQQYISRRPTSRSKERRPVEAQIQDLYKIIDAIYTMVTDIVHESLGVGDIEAPPSNHFAGPAAAPRRQSAQ